MGRGRLGTALLAALLGCVPDGGRSQVDEDARAATAATGASPTPCEVARAHLRLEDGTELYVEPEEILRIGSDFLVVGSPTYTWARRGTGVGPSSIDQHLAARFDLEGVARLVEKPIRGTIGSVRAVGLGGSSWAAVFDEIHPDSLPSKHHRLAFWYGEHDGTRWTVVERLPEPLEGELDLNSDSELVRLGETLHWVVPARLPFGRSALVHYQRRAGAWRQDVSPDEFTEVVTLAADSLSGELWMARVSEDPGLPGWQQTLRLHRRVGEAWDLAGRIAEEPPGTMLRDPRISVHDGSLTITWWLLGAETPAYARVGVGVGRDGVRVTLDASVTQVIPLVDASVVGPSWLLNHLNRAFDVAELRLLRGSPASAAGTISTERVASTPNPYAAFFAALPLANQIVVVGPEQSLDPSRAPVRSLVLRLSTSCT